MKKFIYIIFILATCLLISCGNRRGQIKPIPNTPEEFTVSIDEIINTDHEHMYLNYKDNFRWFETDVAYNDYLNSDSCKFIAEICNVFMIWEDETNESYDTRIITFIHRPGSTFIDEKPGFWLQNRILNRDSIKLDFSQAFNIMKNSKFKIPYSKYCVLRKEREISDTCNTNPQYIFGNFNYRIYIDAITGETRDTNPVLGRKEPSIGDWPKLPKK